MKKIIWIIVVVIVLFTVAFGAYYLGRNSSMSKQNMTPVPTEITAEIVVTPIPNNDIVIDKRLEASLVDMLERHIYTKDASEYISTLSNEDDEYLFGFFQQRKYSDVTITSMMAGLSKSELKFEGGFVYVSVILNGRNVDYVIGVTKDTGKWLVYDYD